MIRLDHVLREATASNYRDLVTRPTGAAVRNSLLSTLRASPRTQALLDFSQIGLVDFSCADEVVAKLVGLLHDLPVFRVVLHGVREDHAEAIDHALGRHQLAIVALVADPARPTLLGAVSDDGRAVFDALLLRDRAAVESLAQALAWQAGRAREALESLVALRCILAHPDATYELGALT